MKESRLIQEVPKSADFHSVVMTTFSFDFNHFEAQVLRTLRQQGLTSFTVLADTTMLDKSIGFSTGHLKSIANYYSVHTVPCNGAFHPKILFLAGENEVMFIQGSGNITTAGHGKNHELFTAFYANEKNQDQLSIIRETWVYLKELMGHIKGITSAKIEALERNCSLLNSEEQTRHQWHQIDDYLRVSSLYNDDSSIWSQLMNLLPVEEIRNIKVFSPYYDEKGTLIDRIATDFNCDVHAYMQHGIGIHPHKMTPSPRISFLDWDSTTRSGNRTKKYVRRLHAKLFWFDAGEKQYCLTGSANCTQRAFGSVNSRGANDEYSLLYELNDSTWLEELGLTGDSKPIEPQSNKFIEAFEKELEQEQERNARKIRLLGIDQNDEILTIYLNSNVKFDKASLCICNKWGEEIEQKEIRLNKDKVEINVSKEIYPAIAYAYLKDEESQIVSNKQVVNTFFDRWNSDPSRENRSVIKLTGNIELGKNKLFDIVDFMNTLYKSGDEKAVKNEVKPSTGSSEKKKAESPASMTYTESLALERENQEHQKIARHHNAVQLFDAIERYFRESAREEEEEDMDDEEDIDSATSGRKRKERKGKKPSVPLNSLKVLEERRKKTATFLSNYDKTLDKAVMIDDHRTGLIDFAMYLLVLDHLADVGGRKVEIKVTSDQDIDENEVLFPIQGSYKEFTSLNSALFNLVGKFVSLVHNAPVDETVDTYTKHKLDKYLLLAREKTLFMLATMSHNYSLEDARASWYELLAFNVMNVLGPLDTEYSKPLRKFSESDFPQGFKRKSDSDSKTDSTKDVQIDEVSNILNQWIKDFSEIESRKDLEQFQNFGICRIIKSIPVNDKPKFMRIARPGYPFNEDYSDFAVQGLYEVKTGMLKSSLQRFKKSNC